MQDPNPPSLRSPISTPVWIAGLLVSSAIGAATGAAAAWLADPVSGAARRARIRDQSLSLFNRILRRGDRLARQAVDRARGLAAETAARVSRAPETIDDNVLSERVRSEFGRVVTATRLINVTARDGVVTLTGFILADELDRCLTRAREVEGVVDVIDELEPVTDLDEASRRNRDFPKSQLHS